MCHDCQGGVVDRFGYILSLFSPLDTNNPQQNLVSNQSQRGVVDEVCLVNTPLFIPSGHNIPSSTRNKEKLSYQVSFLFQFSSLFHIIMPLSWD